MDIATLANLINAIAVTAGVIFAAVQIREFRRQQRRHSMYTVVQTFQDVDFTKALHFIMELPDNLDHAEIRRRVGPEGEAAIYFVSTTWETIGVLVFQRELTLDLVDDFFSGPIVLTWRKLEPNGTGKIRCAGSGAHRAPELDDEIVAVRYNSSA